MDAHVLGKGEGGTVFGDETETGEGDLEVAGAGGEDDVGDTLEPDCTATYARAVEGEDEDFTVVD